LPFSWTIVKPAFSTALSTSSSSGLTKTPTTSHLRRNAAPMAAASAALQRRGLAREAYGGSTLREVLREF